jgi:thiamine-phosphate pyrophosphorylase
VGDPLDRCLVIQITDLEQVPRAELLRRIDAFGGRSFGNETERPQPVVVLRDPQLAGHQLLAFARELRERTRASGTWLWINDRLDVAKLVEADGVHLGRRSVTVGDARSLLGDDALVSVSAHDLDDVKRARDASADVCMLSPIFASPGKGTPLGTSALHAARALMGDDCHLVALGGIDLERGLACVEAGADGFAAIRADLSARR